MNLEGNRLREISPKKTNTVQSHLRVESGKNHKLTDKEIRLISFSGGEGKSEKDGPKVQTSSYKINKHWGCNVQRDDYNTVLLYTGKLRE